MKETALTAGGFTSSDGASTRKHRVGQICRLRMKIWQWSTKGSTFEGANCGMARDTTVFY